MDLPDQTRLRRLLRRASAPLLFLAGGWVGTACSDPAQAIVPDPPTPACGTKFHPGHYGLVPAWRSVESDLDKIVGSDFVGLQVRYDWKDLEGSEGVYDFSAIEADLSTLGAKGLRLVAQIQDKSFRGVPAVPDYLLTDPRFEGGAFSANGGVWMPLLWDEQVLAREVALFEALGARFDTAAYFEAVNFQETAFPKTGSEAFGYTDDGYFLALVRRAAATRAAFPHTVVIQYVNWLSGPTIGNSREALGSLADSLQAVGVGWGGPDLVPFSLPGKIPIPAYAFYTPHAGRMPLGAAVQEPEMGGSQGTFTARELFDFGVDSLRLNYIFWVMVEDQPPGTNPPGFSSGVVPHVRARGGTVRNLSCPTAVAPCAPCVG